MSNAKRDANYITIGMGVSSVDGITPLPILMDATTGAVLAHVADTTTNGSVTAVTRALNDANGNPVAMASNGTSAQALFIHNGYLATKAD